MSQPEVSSRDEAALAWLRHALLTWYDEHARELPWRLQSDPYAIWVSEIMLQQTQVVTVKAYYERWMAKFPTVEDLAQAPLDDVLALWAGLGYYRRARFLHQGAQRVVEAHGGQLPRDVAGLRALPGIGAYTAGAIASIAFGLEAPLVDGNVERILARHFAIEGDPKATANQKQFWALAGALVKGERPGDFNQAMMELGATICTPKKPACLLCPVRQRCEAFALGEVLAYPGKVARKAPREEVAQVALLWAPGEDGQLEVFACQRPEDGLLAGMWEFLVFEGDEEGLKAQVMVWTGLEPSEPAQRLGDVVHVFTHIRLTMQVWLLKLDRPQLQLDLARAARWVRLAELDALALSGAQRKVLSHALEAL